MIVDAWEVAMKQPTQQVCLTLEVVGGLRDLLGVQVPLAHLLDGYGAIPNLDILCLVDCPHATLAQTAQDAIAPLEQRMGGKQSGGGKGTGSWSAVYDGWSRCNDWHGLPAGDAKPGLRSIGAATDVPLDHGRYHRRSS